MQQMRCTSQPGFSPRYPRRSRSEIRDARRHLDSLPNSGASTKPFCSSNQAQDPKLTAD
jgi:hypothetical protein